MAVDESGYGQQMLHLLPEGPVWPRDPESMIAKVCMIPAAALARVDAKADRLIDDMDPRTTQDLFDDWQRNYGLPDRCTPLASLPDERRRRLIAKVNEEGGQSIPFFIGLVETLGYPGSTITEFRPFKANSRCNDGINQNGWRFAWRVNVPAGATVRRMSARSPCNAPLASWGDDTLQCILAGAKPAHTVLYVAYIGDYS